MIDWFLRRTLATAPHNVYEPNTGGADQEGARRWCCEQDVRGCGPTLSVVSRPETQYSPVCSISCLDTSPAGIQARPVSTPARLLLRSQNTGHISRVTLPLQGPAKYTCRPDSSYSGSRPVAQHPADELLREGSPVASQTRRILQNAGNQAS